MKKVLALALTVGFGLAVAAFAQDATQTKPDPSQSNPSQSQSGKVVTGTITSIDNAAKTFVVKDESGQNVTVYWSDATRVSGDLKEGAAVSVQTNDEGGKTMATTIQVRTKKSY